MTSQSLKIASIICFVACGILLFVAWERYNTNANNVEAMNQMSQSSPLGLMMGGGNFEPATPAATKYALLFSVVAGGAGVVCIVGAIRKCDSGVSASTLPNRDVAGS